MNSEDKKNLLVDGENKDDNVSVVHLNKETGQLTDLLLFYWLTSSHDAAVIGNNGHLTSIEIPSTIEWNGKRYAVTSINDRAFENCKKLTSVVIPNTVKSIGEYAFLGCSSLNSIMAPKGFHNFVIKTLKNRNLVIAENISLEEESGFLTDLMLYYRIISETEVEIVKYRHYLSEISDIPSVIIWNNKCYYVTKICDYAFEECLDIPSIFMIPNGVKEIGNEAFINCSNLTSIIIPNSVTKIGTRAFVNCKKLNSIFVPSSVSAIGYGAFIGCSSLSEIFVAHGNSVYDSRYNCNAIIETKSNTLIAGCKNTVIPDGVKKIDDGAFLGHNNLTSIIIPNSVIKIGKWAFEGCSNMTIVKTSDNVSIIEESTFRNCRKLMSFEIPLGVTSIGEKAFEGCNSLSVITISTSVKSIGERAFDGCGSLSSITIPDTVTSIGPYAFINCRGLSSIEVAKANLRYDSRENCNAIVETESNTLITGCKNTIIPRSVTTIADGAFEGCKDLTAINLHNYIEEIGCEAFKDCHSLTSVNIPASVTDIGGGAFEGCYGLNSIKVAKGNPRYDSRDNCNAIIETDFNELIIGCKNTYIPSSVWRIGYSAFYGCSNLTSIAIPAIVTSIERSAFYGCEGLTKIKVDRENTKYDSRENCNAIIETSSNCLILGCKDSIIPSGVTSIGESAISRCKGLISVSIPKGVTAIGENAFEDCSDLSAITIPDSVEEIGHGAFFGCNKLTSISIPSSMKKIGWGAFWGCKGLTSITIPQGVTTIEWEAFADCIALSSITIPDSVTEIGAGAFSGCLGLTSVTIPDSVTKIDIQAFENCRGLKTIIIPNKLNDIGNDAFKGCTCTIRRRDGTTYIPKYIPIKPFDNKQLEDLPF